jgi:hypothetical protein
MLFFLPTSPASGVDLTDVRIVRPVTYLNPRRALLLVAPARDALPAPGIPALGAFCHGGRRRGQRPLSGRLPSHPASRRVESALVSRTGESQ